MYKRKSKLIAIPLAILAFLLIYKVVVVSSKQPTSTSSLITTYAYVANNSDNTLTQYRSDQQGRLASLKNRIFAISNKPTKVVISSNKIYVICPNINSFDDTKILMAQINADGTLIPLTNNDLALAFQLNSLSFSSNKKFAYATSSPKSLILQFHVGPNGRLIPLRNFLLRTASSPISMTFSPSGKYLYVASLADDVISQYRVSDNGDLIPLSTPTISAGRLPNYLAVSPVSNFLFVADEYQDILTYRINPDGELSPLSKYSLSSEKYEPDGMVVSPDGRFLYVINGKLETILQFRVGNNGKIVPLDNPSVKAGVSPLQIAISSNGFFAYAINGSDNTISQFRISPDGNLQPLSPATVPTGKSPWSIVVTSPDAHH